MTVVQILMWISIAAAVVSVAGMIKGEIVLRGLERKYGLRPKRKGRK